MDKTTLEKTFEALVKEAGPMGYSIALRMLGDEERAHDAMQDAYVSAYKGLPGFRGDSSPRTWFIRIVINSCKGQRRLWHRWERLFSMNSNKIDQQSADNPGFRDPWLKNAISDAVASLPHRQKTAFILRHSQELSLKEIANVMDCSLGTIKATLFKAIRNLRSKLQCEVKDV